MRSYKWLVLRALAITLPFPQLSNPPLSTSSVTATQLPTPDHVYLLLKTNVHGRNSNKSRPWKIRDRLSHKMEDARVHYKMKAKAEPRAVTTTATRISVTTACTRPSYPRRLTDLDLASITSIAPYNALKVQPHILEGEVSLRATHYFIQYVANLHYQP